MVAIKSKDVESFLAKSSQTIQVALFYGPDSGLSRQRGERWLVLKADPESGRFARFDGDALASDPSAFLDTVYGQSLFEPTIGCSVSVGTRPLQNHAKDLFTHPPTIPVSFLAGELPPSSALRKAFEGERGAAAIPSFALEGRNLVQHIHASARSIGLELENDAALSIAALGMPDSSILATELHKLAAYIHPRTRASVLDVETILIPSTDEHASVDWLDPVFSGEGSHVSTPQFSPTHMPAILRHVYALKRAVDIYASSGDVDLSLSPFQPVFFKRKAQLQRQIKLWKPKQLDLMISRLAELEKRSRLNPTIDEEILLFALSAITRQAATLVKR
ncbi:MAG: hypothetical protein AAF619_04340 [Pseudomonadota bacterium]